MPAAVLEFDAYLQTLLRPAGFTGCCNGAFWRPRLSAATSPDGSDSIRNSSISKIPRDPENKKPPNLG